jgi:glycosyltransferase involved in cell wall biosynthesis
MHDIVISVIVTTYNRQKLLDRTLKSILNQTFSDFELIVIDNYSDYDFIDYISSLNDKRIVACKNKNYGIIAANRNYGIRKAQGKYIAFCDDDDIWSRNKLERVIESINMYPNAILFCHDEDVVFNGIKKTVYKYGPSTKDMHKSLLFKGNRLSTSAVCVRRSTAMATEGFSEKRKFISAEDYEYWLRLSREGDFIFIREILGEYHIRGNNYSQNIRLHRKAINEVREYHFLKWLSEHPEDWAHVQISKGIVWIKYLFEYLNNKKWKMISGYN